MNQTSHLPKSVLVPGREATLILVARCHNSLAYKGIDIHCRTVVVSGGIPGWHAKQGKTSYWTFTWTRNTQHLSCLPRNANVVNTHFPGSILEYVHESISNSNVGPFGHPMDVDGPIGQELQIKLNMYLHGIPLENENCHVNECGGGAQFNVRQ